MKIRVRYFAQLRETMGSSEEWVETVAHDVAGLRRELMARGAREAEALAEGQALRCALNQQLCPWHTPLHPEAEVAFFPPVTGG
jgi:sulfur-carrier protein